MSEANCSLEKPQDPKFRGKIFVGGSWAAYSKMDDRQVKHTSDQGGNLATTSLGFKI